MARIAVAAAREAVVAAALAARADGTREEVPLGAALDRTLSTDLGAPHDLPPFATSAMDGFALLPAGAGSSLRLVGESRAGRPAERTPGIGEAISISTGAPAPDGTGVAPVEEVRHDPQEGTVTLDRDVRAGDHVRSAGEDITAGAVALPAGTRLGPAELAVAATCGVASVECSARPTVAIVVTGDELVAAGEPLGPGQIHESNGVALAALCRRVGAEVVSVDRAADEFEATADALATALAGAGIVIASGGVSVGRHDHVRPALERIGVEQVFSGVALKPGGPTWFGTADGGGRLVFGLPGNPASAFVTFQLFVAAAVRTLLGAEPIPAPWPCELSEAIGLRPREQAIRVTVGPRSDGPPLATPTGAQGSHRTSSLSGAWGLALLPSGEGEMAAGTVVPVEPLGA